MTKEDFRALFQRALNTAADNAEAKFAKPIPRSFMIELHGAGCPGRVISIDEAVDKMYLGADRFFLIIDVAIKELLPKDTVAFVRVSDHPPGVFSATWDPASMGPFKQIVSERLVDRRAQGG
jgi:hypothetical protein